jgi:hypothetical protein
MGIGADLSGPGEDLLVEEPCCHPGTSGRSGILDYRRLLTANEKI